MNQIDKKTQDHQQGQYATDGPEIGLCGRNVPYASVRGPIIGVGIILARSLCGSHPGGPEEEAGDLQALLLCLYCIGNKAIQLVPFFKDFIPILMSPLQALDLGGCQGERVLFRVIAIRLDLSFDFHIDEFLIQVIKLLIELAMFQFGNVVPNRFGHDMECGC